VEEFLKRKSLEKVELAIQATPLMTKELMSGRFDLAQQLTKIVDTIRSWNG
jgi:hypothetical protein